MFRAAIVSALVATASAQLPLLGGAYGIGAFRGGVIGGVGVGLPTVSSTSSVDLSQLNLGQSVIGAPLVGQSVYGIGAAYGVGAAYGGQYRDPELSPFVPVFQHVNPNSVTSYVNQLYEHGMNMLNRVKQQLGGRLEGPPINRIPITIPAGYTPHDMEELYGQLYLMASCLSPSYFQRLGPRVHPGPTWDAWNPRTPFSLDNCLYEVGQRWIEDHLEPYITTEAQSLLTHLQHNPRTGLISVPSFANFWRTHTPIEERALIDTVIATYNLIDRMIDETYRITYPGPGHVFTQDFNEIIASPRALLDFGFPPGFAPTNAGVDAEWYSLDLTVREMFCRSQIGALTGRRTIPTADPFINADGTPNYENWPQQYGYQTGRGAQGYGGTFGGWRQGYSPYGGPQNVGPWGWNQFNGGGATPWQFQDSVSYPDYDGPGGFFPRNNWVDRRWYNNDNTGYENFPNPPTYADITSRFQHFAGQEDCFSDVITDWFFDEAEDMVDEILSAAIKFVRPAAVEVEASASTAGGLVFDAAALPLAGVQLGGAQLGATLPEFPGYTWDAASGTFVATGNAGRLAAPAGVFDPNA